MTRRLLSPVQALLLLLLIGLVVVFGILGRRDARTNPSGARIPDAGVPAEEVVEILIRRGAATFRVLREADGFWLVEPYRDRADDRLIAQSIRVGTTLAPLRTLPDTLGAPFGLDHPAASWRCTWRGGSVEVALGDTLPAGGGRFVRRSGSSQILVVDPFLARRYLSPPAADLHQPAAALLDVGPVDSVRIRTREESLLVVRRQADYWEFLRPFRVEGSAAQLTRAVSDLRTDALTEFLGPLTRCDLKAMGLDPPRASWTLIQGTRRQEVRIGHPTPDQKSVHVIPADRQVVALISSENFRQWVDGLPRLRETQLLSTPADSLASVEISQAKRRRLFLRAGAVTWREIASSDTLDVRSDAFEMAVENICLLRAVGFGPVGGRPDAAADLRLLLSLRSQRADTLWIAPPRGGVCEAWGPRQPGTCMVAPETHRTWSLWLEHPRRR